jgi:hypothetical protein
MQLVAHPSTHHAAGAVLAASVAAAERTGATIGLHSGPAATGAPSRAVAKITDRHSPPTDSPKNCGKTCGLEVELSLLGKEEK